MNNTPLMLLGNDDEEQTPSNNWFKIIPPRDVRSRWARQLKQARRPARSLALPAIATTASLHFTGTIHSGDRIMAFGLTSLIVGYDAVIAVCRTWRQTTSTAASDQRTETVPARRAA
ncbi:hypothetical protein [Streptomyces collinus]|uniref:hypothetical protein n=1 Tax=Streptomyces collinus TaxID=42684 RepID=UPI0033FCA77B